MTHSVADQLPAGVIALFISSFGWIVFSFVPAILLLMTCATTSWAQSRQDSLKTFTSPDGAFAFRYSRQLIHCQHKEQGPGDGYWIPAENCVAYHPVCDGVVGQDNTAIACFAYPRNRFTDTSAFEAATFSVEIVNRLVTEKDCLSGPADQMFLRRPPVEIHGVSFVVFKFGEAGMNQSVGGELYRTFHREKCYQMGINVAMANAQTFDPPARDLTKADRREVNRQLERARDSFRFLN